jgi:hypothetical protein
MVLWVMHYDQLTASDRTALEYDPNMPMGRFLRDVIAPACGLVYVDGTVLAKVHTPELRVVFNNEVSAVTLGSLVRDWDCLVISPWPKDGITVRSLQGNARDIGGSE